LPATAVCLFISRADAPKSGAAAALSGDLLKEDSRAHSTAAPVYGFTICGHAHAVLQQLSSNLIFDSLCASGPTPNSPPLPTTLRLRKNNLIPLRCRNAKLNLPAIKSGRRHALHRSLWAEFGEG